MEYFLLRAFASFLAVFAFAGLALPEGAEAAGTPEPGAIERTIPRQNRQDGFVPILALPGREASSHRGDNKRFTLGAVNIDGATVFSQQELSRYFENYLATQVDENNLAQMAKAITGRYRKTGYMLSYAMVPPQNVDAGMVRLAVVEGRVDKISVEGAGSASSAIEAIAAPLANGAPLRDASLERTIGLIRDFPGLSVMDIALMRSVGDGSRYTLKIKVAADRVRGFTYADNRGTGSAGHSRLYNSLSMSSIALPGDELRIDLFAMPGGHSRYLYGQLLASIPLGARGMRLTVSGSKGDQYLRADQHFRGQTDNVSAQLSFPFLRSRALTLVGKTSLTDWSSLGTQEADRKLRDRLRIARAGLEFRNEGSTRFEGELVISRGLAFGSMTRIGDPLASRPDASGRFTKVAFSAQVSRMLGEQFTLRATAIAQYADRPLLSAEEFSLGGNRVGRAFDFNDKTGDSGAGGGLEISYRPGSSKAGRGLELFGFVDGGFARDLGSTVSQGVNHRLASTGLGARLSLAGSTIAIETDAPLTGARRPRVFASIFRSF